MRAKASYVEIVPHDLSRYILLSCPSNFLSTPPTPISNPQSATESQLEPSPKLVTNFHQIPTRTTTMAPASTRSSSISSASTSSSKNSDSSIKKKFGCSHPGCGKSFSRSEHLHRHALNHKDGNNTCRRCSAHFRRRDLLGKSDIWVFPARTQSNSRFRQTYGSSQGEGR